FNIEIESINDTKEDKSVNNIPKASTSKKKYSNCSLKDHNAYIYPDFIEYSAIDINEIDDINKKKYRICGL
ncbi:4194_t:CDS:2, partial [Racocetra persica]